MATSELGQLLTSWHTLHEAIMDLDERQVQKLLEREKDGRARLHMLLRLHARLCRLRQERERAELIDLASEELKSGRKARHR